jgi:hypothetical protein
MHMATESNLDSSPTVLLVATRNTVVASRMAIRFSQAGCKVAAVYPSKGHLLAATKAVTNHFHMSLVDPGDSILKAMRESGAKLAIPCDGMMARCLHALYGGLPSTPEGGAVARAIESSLGDPTAFLVIDSRHEIQTAAREDGLNAVESYALGIAADPETLARTVPFPWELKTDYSWGNRDHCLVGNLAEARDFIRLVSAPPSLATALKRVLVNADRTALGEWLHGKRSGLSAQRPREGSRAIIGVACWHGTVVASIAAEVVAPIYRSGSPAVVRMIENGEMERTARRISQRLGLSGFHSFEFVLDREAGSAWLTEFNSCPSLLSHLSGGQGHDLVDAFLQRWRGRPAVETQTVRGNQMAIFPSAWAANPKDPILETEDYDIPRGDPGLVLRAMKLARRDQRYQGFRDRIGSLLGFQ